MYETLPSLGTFTVGTKKWDRIFALMTSIALCAAAYNAELIHHKQTSSIY